MRLFFFFSPRISIHTYDNSPNGEEYEGIFLEESLDVILGDLLHFPLCLHGPYMDAFPESLHPVVEVT